MLDQLRAVPLEIASLVEALKKLCEALGHRTGATVDFMSGRLPQNGALTPGSHEAILRVAQEACANIGRHARARHVTVSLNSVSESLVLQIQDDGAGFDPLAARTGMGISNMRARADEFGAKFELTSQTDGGTIVTFSLPLSAENSVASRRELIRQALLYVAVFGAVVVLEPRNQRAFAVAAWAIAGTLRVVYWVRARRKTRVGRAMA